MFRSVQNTMVRECKRRFDTVENIHEVIGDPCPRTAKKVLLLIIHQIFSLARDWSKHIT